MKKLSLFLGLFLLPFLIYSQNFENSHKVKGIRYSANRLIFYNEVDSVIFYIPIRTTSPWTFGDEVIFNNDATFNANVLLNQQLAEGWVSYDADSDTGNVSVIGFSQTNTNAAGTLIMQFKNESGNLFSWDSLGASISAKSHTIGSDALNLSGILAFVASDNDQGQAAINTSDQLVWSGFSGGFDVDGDFTAEKIQTDNASGYYIDDKLMIDMDNSYNAEWGLSNLTSISIGELAQANIHLIENSGGAYQLTIGGVVKTYSDGTGFNIGKTTSPQYPFSVTLDSDGVAQDSVFMVDVGGNVGIGTTGPIGKLHVIGAPILLETSAIEGIYLEGDVLNSGYGTDANYALGINYEGYQSGNTQFRDLKIFDGKRGVIVFFDGSSGNVGIGTTSPVGLTEWSMTSDTLVMNMGDVGAVNAVDVDTSGILFYDISGNPTIEILNSAGLKIQFMGMQAVTYTSSASQMWISASFDTLFIRGSSGNAHYLELTDLGAIH